MLSNTVSWAPHEWWAKVFMMFNLLRHSCLRDLMWGIQVSRESKISPRNVCCFTVWSGEFPRFSGWKFDGDCFLEKSSTLVFSEENVNPFVSAHLWAVLIEFWIEVLMESMFFPLQWISMSSAKREILTGRFISLLTSFIATIKSVLLRTDPWGTPFSSWNVEERVLLSLTLKQQWCFLLVCCYVWIQ